MKLGVLFKSQVMRGVSSGSGRSWADPEQVLGRSWAVPGHLGKLLGCLGRLLGESLAGLGLLLGVLVGSWTALGLSWAAFGHSWAALESSWAPSWSQDGRQEAQSRPQDPPKSKPRRYKTMLTCQKLFRTPFWELRDEFWSHLVGSWARLGRRNSGKKHGKINIFIFFLEGHFVAQDAPKRREGWSKMAFICKNIFRTPF